LQDAVYCKPHEKVLKKLLQAVPDCNCRTWT